MATYPDDDESIKAYWKEQETAATGGSLPVLNYAGTSGYSGSETSEDAAFHDLISGVTSRAQKLTLILARWAGERGITIAELREAKGSLHHGKMSSALTNLHAAGRLVALRERRNRCGVYVLPEFVNGRESRAYKPNRKTLDRDAIVQILDDHVPNYDYDGCRCGAYLTAQNGYANHLADVLAEAMK